MTIYAKILREWQVFLLSISIFTRLPIPCTIPKSKSKVIESYKYSGVVGLLIGALAALSFLFVGNYLPENYAICFSLMTSFVGIRFYQGNGFTPIEKPINLYKNKELRFKAKHQAVMFTVLMFLYLIKFMFLVRITNVPSALILSHFLSFSMVFSIIYKYSYSDKNKEWIKGSSINSERQDDMIVLMFIVLAISCSNSDTKLALLLLVVSFISSRVLFLLMSKLVVFRVSYAINIAQSIIEILCYMTFYIVSTS